MLITFALTEQELNTLAKAKTARAMDTFWVKTCSKHNVKRETVEPTGDPLVYQGELISPPKFEDSTEVSIPNRESEILTKLNPFLEQIKEWEDKAKTIVVTNISQKDDMKTAKEGRLFLKRVRLAQKKAADELKEPLKADIATIDGITKAVESRIKPLEEYLAEQETFQDRYEAEQLKLIRDQRMEQIASYETSSDPDMIASMDEATWNIFIAGVRANHEQQKRDKIEAEALAAAKEEVRNRGVELARVALYVPNMVTALTCPREEYLEILSDAEKRMILVRSPSVELSPSGVTSYSPDDTPQPAISAPSKENTLPLFLDPDPNEDEVKEENGIPRDIDKNYLIAVLWGVVLWDEDIVIGNMKSDNGKAAVIIISNKFKEFMKWAELVASRLQ